MKKKVLASVMVATMAVTGITSTASAKTAEPTTVQTNAVEGNQATKALKKFSTTKKIADYYTVEVDDVKNYGDGFFMIKSEGFLKLNGKAYNGIFKDKMYKGGRLASGEVKGKVYYEGVVVNNDSFLGVYYKDGKPLNGVLKHEHFTNGEPTKGIVKDENGKYYKDGWEAYATIDGKYYEKGVVANGVTENNMYYVDGVKATGFVDGVKYVGGYAVNGYGYAEDGKTMMFFEDGNPFTGVNDENIKFVDGVEFEGFYGKGTSNSGKEFSVYYKDGKPFTGFAVPENSTTGESVEMDNGIVKDGDFAYGDGTIRFVDGKFVGFVGADGKIIEGTSPQ